MKTGRRNEGQFLIRVSFELATSLKVLRNLKVVRRASHFHHVSPILSRAVGADVCIAVEKPQEDIPPFNRDKANLAKLASAVERKMSRKAARSEPKDVESRESYRGPRPSTYRGSIGDYLGGEEHG